MISRQVLESLVEKGIQAPSADNLQPWKFRLRGETIALYLDPQRCSEIADAGHRASYLSLGAVIENMVMGASHERYKTLVQPFPHGEDPSLPAAALTFEPWNEPEDPLVRFIEARATNRKFYRRKSISKEVAQALIRTGTVPSQTQLFLVQDQKVKNRLAQWMGAADQIRYENKQVHGEFFKVVRFDPKEVDRLRDGFDIRTAEVGPMERVIFRLISNWRGQAWLNRVGVSLSLNLYTQLQVRSSPAVGFLVSERNSAPAYLEGGRIMQRLWLKATQQSLAIQPMMAIPIFIINLQINNGRYFTLRQRGKILSIKEELFQLFHLTDREGLLMLFRLGYADSPSFRSLRRPISDFLIDEHHPS